MKKTFFKMLPFAFSGLMVVSTLTACGDRLSAVDSGKETHARNTCEFLTDRATYYKVESVEDGIFIHRVTTLKGDSLVSVHTYENAPYTFLASECSDMEGGEVKCEGDKITVITKGDPSVLEEAFGLNMEVDRTLCSMVESEEREVID